MIIIISLFPAFRTKIFHVVFHHYLSLKNVGLEIRTSWDKKTTMLLVSQLERFLITTGIDQCLVVRLLSLIVPTRTVPSQTYRDISRNFDEIYRKMFLSDLSSTIGKNLDFNIWKLRKYVACAINGSKVI